MPKLRVHNFAVSLDGFAAGPDQSIDNPLGVGGTRLHEWPHAPIEMQGGTTFHFVEDGIEAALERATDAAGEADIRLGGGVATIQQYLRAGLVDDLHLPIVPVLLSRGERLFDHLEGFERGYACVELVSSPSVAHVRFARRRD